MKQQLQQLQILQFSDIISSFTFSPDSKFLLIVMQKKSSIEIRSLDDQQWNAKIEDPQFGLLNAIWSPDSRHIITFSEFGLRASIYSLIDKSIRYIKFPKFPNKGISFSKDGQFMALAERNEIKDYIGIYSTQSWQIVDYFQVETNDLEDILWSYDDLNIFSWDSILEVNISKIIFQFPGLGKIGEYHPFQYSLGIKIVKLAPNSKILAIGSFDETVFFQKLYYKKIKLTLINCMTCQKIILFNHDLKNHLVPQSAIVYYFQEKERQDQISNTTSKYFQISPQQAKIPQIKSSQQKEAVGISNIQWSYDSEWVATQNENMPFSIWLWEIKSLSLKFVLTHKQPIKCFQFSPTHLILAIATGNSNIYFWNPNRVSVCEIPTEIPTFISLNVQWTGNGQQLIIQSKNELKIGILTEELMEQNSEQILKQYDQ